MPACAQLPAGPLSRCSLPFSLQVHWDRMRIARKVLGKKNFFWRSFFLSGPTTLA